jgi:hypothetical protein
MQELTFNIPLTGTIRIEDTTLTISINRSETVLDLDTMPKKQRRISLKNRETVFDLVLKAAQGVVEISQQNRFSAAELYHKALEEYPDLKRNSWSGHVIASAPNHPSHNHFATRKDYFRYLGNGMYRLESRYKKLDENNLLES